MSYPRIVNSNDWQLGLECMTCKYIRVFETRLLGSTTVCPKCGALEASWRMIVMRWVVVKTGFWFWQTEGRYEKKSENSL